MKVRLVYETDVNATAETHAYDVAMLATLQLLMAVTQAETAEAQFNIYSEVAIDYSEVEDDLPEEF